MNDSTGMRSVTNALAAAGLGALLMYIFDPQQGKRRAALARDKLRHAARAGADLADAGMRDLGNRARGLGARMRELARGRREVDDEVLVERVRSAVGRLVSHPHAIDVACHGGRIMLSGPVLAHEEHRLVRGVFSVRGVRAIENLLDAHTSAGDTPSLQGGHRRGPRMEFMQETWAPGPRLLSLAGGCALAGYGLARRGAGGTVLGLAGAALALRAATNRGFSRTLGVAGGRRAIDIEKTIHIAAPRERVFDEWSRIENFPHFMSMVEEVRRLDDTHSHWVVRGPAGTRLQWDSVITENVRPQVLAWRSEPGAPVQHEGIVRFDDDGNGGTRVAVRMSYSPLGGAIGHGAATLFGTDPKHRLDDDLMRMKSFIETGRQPHDAARRTAPPMH
jgi:uncharacterized membrane protein